MPKKRIIPLSLKWKATSLILVILLTLCGFLLTLNNQQLNALSEQQLDNGSEQRDRELNGLLNQSFLHTLQLIGLLPTLRTEEGGDGSLLKSTLKRNWTDLQINWGIESASLYDSQGYPLLSLGNGEYSRGLSSSQRLQAPLWTINCQSICRQHILAPIIDEQGNELYIELGNSLADILINFQRITGTNIGILRQQALPHGPAALHLHTWQKDSKLLTQPEVTATLLTELAQNISFESLSQERQILHSSGRTFEVRLAELPRKLKNTWFITINDYTASDQLIRNAKSSLLLLASGGIALSCALMLFMLLNPIRRLHRQAELLPQLSSGNFQHVLQELKKNRSKHWFVDEIDTLNQTQEELCQQLTSLNTEIDQRTDELHTMAMFDSLTNLTNRRGLLKSINELLHNPHLNEQHFSLLFIDLDDFKRINDSLGHNVGDELLKVVAERLKSCVRSDDIIARLGGDEFCIVLRKVHQKSDGQTTANNILEKLRRSVSLQSNDFVVSASIGIVTAPEDGRSSGELLKNADMAMYQAKAMGRNKYQLFEQSMTNVARNRLSLENELLRAIKNREFVLHYQPQYALTDKKIIGFEALIRWQHPTKGLLYPDTFIAALESSGLIIELGNRIIEEACRQLREWLDLEFPAIRIAINVSARQLYNNDLTTEIAKHTQTYGIKPEWLELEVTESLIMDDIEATSLQLKTLQEKGMTIAIDDFGTGHSSLSYLKSLPLDILKIDRSFVNDLDDQGGQDIVSAIIAMAHKLRLKIVAEGVETLEQEFWLRKNLCDFVQGYLYSRPIDVAACTQLLADERAR